MKSVKTFVTRLLLVTSLMLPWVAAEALDTFEQAGTMANISLDGSFTINGTLYRVASDAKLSSSSPDRRRFSDFKRGDLIWCKGRILNGTRYVDIIKYQEPDES